MHSQQDLLVRKPVFTYQADMDPCWISDYGEFACATNSLSAIMPYLEPFFVRSISKSLHMFEGAERSRIKSYLSQETQHHVQHKEYNELLVNKYPKMSWVDKLANRFFKFMSKRLSKKFNIAFAAGSEVIAYSIARWMAARQSNLLRNANPQIAQLYLWHLAEEVEHKDVAHEVWRITDGRKRYYIPALFASFSVLIFFVFIGTFIMMVYEKKIFNPIAIIRLMSWAVTFLFEALPNMVMSVSPHFHPDMLVDPYFYDNYLFEQDLNLKNQNYS